MRPDGAIVVALRIKIHGRRAERTYSRVWFEEIGREEPFHKFGNIEAIQYPIARAVFPFADRPENMSHAGAHRSHRLSVAVNRERKRKFPVVFNNKFFIEERAKRSRILRELQRKLRFGI